MTKWRDPGEEPKMHLFGQLKRITKQWLDNYLFARVVHIPRSSCIKMLADMACERITAAITAQSLSRQESPDKGRARSLQP
jgi:type III restriction enzyme